MAKPLNQTATSENYGRQDEAQLSVLGISGPLDTLQVVSERLIAILLTTQDQTKALVQGLQNIGLDHSEWCGNGSNVLQVSVADVLSVVQEAGA